MKSIYFNTSSIAIEDYKESPRYKKFLNLMSVWLTTNYGGKYKDWEAYIEDENYLYIHRGIDLSILGKYFPEHEYVYDNTPSISKRLNLSLTTPPRDNTQKEAIKYLMSQGKYKCYKDKTQKFLCLKPGAGKTYCAINYICQKKLIPIIILERDAILEQWVDSFLQFTDIKEDEICIFSGKNSINKFFKSGLTKYKVFIAKHQSLQAYCKNDWTLISKLLTKVGVGIKVFDEAHAYWKNIFNIDLYTDTKNTLYLTATPFVSNHMENQVYNLMFDNIPSFGYDLKFDNVYHYVFYTKWNSHPTSIEETNMSNGHGFNLNAYNDYLLRDDNINEFFHVVNTMLSQLINDNQKVAIIVNCNNMVQKLHDLLQEEYPGRTIGMYCGLIKQSEKPKELEKDIIISTLRGFNKGIDVENLAVLINTCSISSNTLIDQLSGRLRYNKNFKSVFVDLTDCGFKQCRSHLTYRKRFLDKIAKKCYEVEI